MISSLAGDIIGSRFEFHNMFDENFELFSSKCNFTDDSVLTVATADVILNGGEYADKYLKYAQEHQNRGYGGHFLRMVTSGKLIPYNSYGNGSAMRISPVGWAFNSFDETMKEAKKSAECTHDHPEGIKGAQAIAAMIYMGRLKESKKKMKEFIGKRFGYDLSTPLGKLPSHFDVTCQRTVPKSIIIFSETENFEDAMRKSIISGGDVDTIACIVGGMCDAYYGLPPEDIIESVYQTITPEMADTVTKFVHEYIDKDIEL